MKKNTEFLPKTMLTTNFSGDKKCIKDRFSNIFDFKKKKSGILVLCLVITVAMAMSLLVACQNQDISNIGGSEDPNSAYASSDIQDQTAQLANTWAKALKDRDGKARYDIMSKDMQSSFYQKQLTDKGEEALWDIGISSPWVHSYVVAAEDNSAVIKYTYTDSTNTKYESTEKIKTGIEDGKLVVIESKADDEFTKVTDDN